MLISAAWPTARLPAATTPARTSRRPSSHTSRAATTPITQIQMVIVVSGPSDAFTTSLTMVSPWPSCSLSVR